MNTLIKKGRYLAVLAVLGLAAPVSAQISIDFPQSFAGFSSQEVTTTIENIVRIIFGFLGILVVVAIIFGGFKMLMAFGDSDKMQDGRKIVFSGVIGLIILFAAYSIANFVVNSLQNAV